MNNFELIYTLNFSEQFFVLPESLLLVSTSVCSTRQQKIKTAKCQFGILQGSIFEPTLFSLHVTDVANNILDSLWLRCAGDSAIQKECKVNDINRRLQYWHLKRARWIKLNGINWKDFIDNKLKHCRSTLYYFRNIKRSNHTT